MPAARALQIGCLVSVLVHAIVLWLARSAGSSFAPSAHTSPVEFEVLAGRVAVPSVGITPIPPLSAAVAAPSAAAAVRESVTALDVTRQRARSETTRSSESAPRPTAQPRAAPEEHVLPDSLEVEPAIAERREPAPEVSAAMEVEARNASTATLAAERAQLDLSPRQTALSTWLANPESPEHDAARPSTNAGGKSASRSAAPDQTPNDAAAKLNAALRAAVDARPSGNRPPPDLVRDPDGTCHYAGEAINATIHPDGGVEIEYAARSSKPRYGVDEPVAHPTAPEDQQAPQRLQLSMRVEARAWEAEREWFMRETKELRGKLADAARDRDLARADVRLRWQLDQIWCDTKISEPERRHRIFELWDDTSDDEIGARARAIVVDYVRVQLAANTLHAFSRVELDALNAMRSRSEAFRPYVSVQDAGPMRADAVPGAY